MENINWKMSRKFGSHWIKVKFYQNKPQERDVKQLENVRFCQATRLSVIQPLILDKPSINCPGAQHAFGWSDSPEAFLKNCREKNNVSLDTLQSILSGADSFKEPIRYIGLNTGGVPDLVLSYVTPAQAMTIVRAYQEATGKNLDISLCGMMSICGGVAVRTYVSEDVTFSFGCKESRQWADLGQDIMAVGVPRRLFELFVNGAGAEGRKKVEKTETVSRM